jgi:hypothetical protein
LDLAKIVADFWRNELSNQPSGRHDHSLHQICGRVSDRTLIFGLACFAIGVWVGRLTAHEPVLWGLLGS